MSNHESYNMHNDKITQGVSCVVDSCKYHSSGDLCRAGKIEIKPKDATSTDETDCATFVNSNEHSMSWCLLNN